MLEADAVQAIHVTSPADWPTVRFGNVVKNVTETCRDPEAEGLERYLGLEHLDGGELAIRRWGDLAADDVSFTRRFRKGQVLFGKRRAYQRKVALVEFDGICSSDILTFESKDSSVLLPDLLPFLCQTDAFFDHALGTSAGSLSPRTRWSQLKTFEFPLPPLDEQKRLAELLWAAEEVVRRLDEVIVSARCARRAVAEDAFAQLSGGDQAPLKDLWIDSPRSGFSAAPASYDTGCYTLSLACLSPYGYIRGHYKPVEPVEQVTSCRLSKGDLLISRSNTVELVGLAGIFDEDRNDISYPDLMFRVNVDASRIRPQYLELVLLSRHGRRHMQRVAAGTSGSMKKINRQTLGRLAVPTPDVAQQDQILEQIERCDASISRAIAHSSAMRSLKAALINTMTTGRDHG